MIGQNVVIGFEGHIIMQSEYVNDKFKEFCSSKWNLIQVCISNFQFICFWIYKVYF